MKLAKVLFAVLVLVLISSCGDELDQRVKLHCLDIKNWKSYKIENSYPKESTPAGRYVKEVEYVDREGDKRFRGVLKGHSVLYALDDQTGKPVAVLSFGHSNTQKYRAFYDLNGDGRVNCLDDRNNDGFVDAADQSVKSRNYNVMQDYNGDRRNTQEDSLYLQSLQGSLFYRDGFFAWRASSPEKNLELCPAICALLVSDMYELKNLMALDVSGDGRVALEDDINLDGYVNAEDSKLFYHWAAQFGSSAFLKNQSAILFYWIDQYSVHQMFDTFGKLKWAICDTKIDPIKTVIPEMRQLLFVDRPSSPSTIGGNAGLAAGSGVGIWAVISGAHPVIGPLCALAGYGIGRAGDSFINSAASCVIKEIKYFQVTQEESGTARCLAFRMSQSKRWVIFVDMPETYTWRRIVESLDGEGERITDGERHLTKNGTYRVIVSDSVGVNRQVIYQIAGRGKNITLLPLATYQENRLVDNVIDYGKSDINLLMLNGPLKPLTAFCDAIDEESCLNTLNERRIAVFINIKPRALYSNQPDF